MLFGTILRNVVKKEALSRVIPIAKKVLQGAGQIAVQEATRGVGTKTVDVISKAPKKVEDYVDKKKSEFIDEAEIKAERLFAKQMEILNKNIDEKIVEVEGKFDEKIRAIFLLFIISSFFIMTLAGLAFSLLLRYFDL